MTAHTNIAAGAVHPPVGAAPGAAVGCDAPPSSLKLPPAAGLSSGGFLRESLLSLRERAAFFAAKRRSDGELYEVLAACLALCEEIDATDQLEEVKALTIARRSGRAYFEKGADAPLVVCRYVFETEKRRDACWRYTATLREARKRGLTSATLVEFLALEGGINSLFRGRSVTARSVTTKTLHLNSGVVVPKDETFTLTLRRDHRGFFDVVAS